MRERLVGSWREIIGPRPPCEASDIFSTHFQHIESGQDAEESEVDLLFWPGAAKLGELFATAFLAAVLSRIALEFCRGDLQIAPLPMCHPYKPSSPSYR